MHWLSYYNQAYELNMAIYRVKARMQNCSEMDRVMLGEAVKLMDKEKELLISMGDNARATSKEQTSINQAGPAERILRERFDFPATNGTETESAGSGS